MKTDVVERLRRFMEDEARSCSMDFGGITPLYVYRMWNGDVPTTYADATALERDFGFTPKITLREGLRKFAEWYKEYYG